MFQPRQKPVCGWCGSEEVKGDAFARWDSAAQDWTLESVYDKYAWCEDCESDTSLHWIDAAKTLREMVS